MSRTATLHHACEHLRAIRDACLRAADSAGSAWLEQQYHAVKQGHWAHVMAAMAALHFRGAVILALRGACLSRCDLLDHGTYAAFTPKPWE